MGIVNFFISHLKKLNAAKSEKDSVAWTKQEDGTYTSDIPEYDGMSWEKRDNGDFLLIDDIQPEGNYCEYEHRQMERAIRCGWMPKGMKKVWSVGSLERTCPDCLRLEGMALGMDEKFTSGDASVLYPPLHDGCRCVLKYIEPDRLENYSEPHRNMTLIEKCAAYIKNSSSVYEVYEKYTVLLEVMEKMLHDSKSPPDEESILFLSELPNKYNYLVEHKVETFNDAIERQYTLEVADASTLKTERGRRNRVKRFYESVAELPLPEESIAYARALYENYVP